MVGLSSHAIILTSQYKGLTLKLYLVRHGQYVPIDISMTCPLSLEGEAEIKRLASHLSRIRLKVPQIYHSSKCRARQTAEILADQLKSGQCEYLEGLEPNDPILPMIRNIRSRSEDIMLVGHLPFIGKLTNQLITAQEDISLIDYQPGTVVCLHFENDQWLIEWVLVPGMY